jgi:hypothetical protein
MAAQNGWRYSKIFLRQVASLQLILHKAKIESALMESVDLRFDRPVVIYSPMSKNKSDNLGYMGSTR